VTPKMGKQNAPLENFNAGLFQCCRARALAKNLPPLWRTTPCGTSSESSPRRYQVRSRPSMPRSGFARRRSARMRYAAGAADGTDAAAGADTPLPPPPGMPFSRRGRRGRQAPGDTGSVLPKLIMKMIVYGIVIFAMKYGKKEGKDVVSDRGARSPASDIFSRLSSLLDDVLGKSGDQVLLPGAKTLRVGTGDHASDRAANVYVVPNFLQNDVAIRWRDGALYEFERSGGSIPDSHPLSSEVAKTLESSNVQTKLHVLGIEGVGRDAALITSYISMLSHDDNGDGWNIMIPLSDPSNNDASTPTMQFACGQNHVDKEIGQDWCDTVKLEFNTAIILGGAAKFKIASSAGDRHFGVVGKYRARAKEEL